MVLMPWQSVAPERQRVLLDLIGSGMTPNKAAGIAGVSVVFAYKLDRRVNGVPRLAARRAAMAARAAERAARPDRRKMAPERERRTADLIASGLTPNRAAPVAGVSVTFAYALNKRMGGVYRPPETAYSDRYLDREERYEIARLRESGLAVRQIARRMGRAPSTICRELARNAGPRGGGYQPERAHRLAWERQRRPKPSKLSGCPALRAEVQAMLDRRYSPEQISGRLRVGYPDDPAMRVSHESIYQSIYLYPRGQLKRELQACLRSGRDTRRRRGRREMRGKIIGAVPIGERPAEVEGRLVPGHHEGDLIMGSKASNSAVGTIVGRSTGYLTLLPLPGGYDAASVADAIIEQMSALPSWFAKTLTWDRGRELARHQRVTAAGIQVYFADPYSPWQRGSNENINGLLREYLPKGTDLSQHTAEQLQAIQDELNDRPRKRFGYRTPREELDRLLTDDLNRVATTP
jgi:transposase, IS30 family